MGYIVAGVVIGGIYAIAATGIVITYASAGVLNFAFAAEAYFVARLFYYLNTQHGWGMLPTVIVSLFIASPLLGLLLYGTLFRFLQFSSTLIKVVATIGLSIAIPALADICFGNVAIEFVPGLIFTSTTYHVFGTAVSVNQLIVLLCVLGIAIVGALIIKFTDVGLAIHATVDSPALTSLSGTSPKVVAAGVWTAMTFLAGLTGILVAPFVGLASESNFTLLIASAFAAVVAARLRHVGLAMLVALSLGILQGVLQLIIPSDQTWLSGVLTAVPFAVMAGFVVYFGVRGQAYESGPTGGTLDHAIAFEGSERHRSHHIGADLRLTEPSADRPTAFGSSFIKPRDIGVIGLMIPIALLPIFVSGLWVGAIGLGFCYAVAFLSFTLLIGESGLISLCQITFAAIGGLTTAELATTYHWPVLAALVVGGVVAVPVGIAVGLLSTVLGDLYIAIVTLTFGVLMDNLVFSLNVFSNSAAGVPVIRPSFLDGPRAFAYFAFAVFCVFALLITNLRRSTTGLGVAAVRFSEPAARTMGLSVFQMKLVITGFATFVAGVGGGLLAIYSFDANPGSYTTLGGLVWLAVIVVIGIRSNIAAIIGGVLFSVVPFLVVTYLPVSWGEAPTALFGFAALLVVRNPDGTVAMHARQLQGVFVSQARRRSARGSSEPRTVDEPSVPESVSSSSVREVVEG